MKNKIIGFIGLGIMGSRMCKNLIKAGWPVIVWNRTREKTKPLSEIGAEVADSPSALASKADIIITMLSTPEAVEEVALGKTGFLHNMKKGSIWINMSTVNPSFTYRIAKEASNGGVRFVDAPVLGSKGAAENAKLVILVGADKKDFEEVKPILETMGEKIINVGEPGKASAFKVVANLMLGHAMLAFAEAVALGESLGLDREFLLNTLTNLPVAAPFLSRKKEKISKMDFSVEFPLELMYKDLHLAAITAYENGLSLPSTNIVKEAYALAKKMGMGREDFSAIYKLIKGRE